MRVMNFKLYYLLNTAQLSINTLSQSIRAIPLSLPLYFITELGLMIPSCVCVCVCRYSLTNK